MKTCSICGETHTPGAMRAAEIIIGEGIERKGKPTKIKTAWGEKTRCGIASLIDNEAKAVLEKTTPEPLKVVVEVLGGVADVTTCPAGVAVEIIDHDNEEHQ